MLGGNPLAHNSGLPQRTMTAEQVQNNKWEEVHADGRNVKRMTEE
jgi:hypothetical protein